MNEGPSLLSINDLIGAPVTLVVLFLLIKWFATKLILDKQLFRLFFLGLFVKTVVIILNLFFHMYVERAGDTHAYFYYGTFISRYFSQVSFEEIIKLMFGDYNELAFSLKAKLPATTFFSATFAGNKVVILVTAILSYFTFDSYVAISIIFSMWAYIGTWLIFYKLVQLYPQLVLHLFLFVVCWPPSMFFGSGVLKDPLCVGALGVMFYIAFSKMVTWMGVLKNILIFSMLGIFVYLIKPYILLSFLFAYTIAMLFSGINLISIKRYRKMFYAGIVIFVFAMILLITVQWESIVYSKSMQEIFSHILITSQAQLLVGNTKYDLGKLEFNPTGVLFYLVKSFNVALFRPFIFEVRNAQLFLSFIESSIMLLLTAYTVFRVGIGRFFSAIGNSFLLMFSFLFVIVLAIQIGAISFNYGTLIRYKIPLTPFFFAFCFIQLSMQKAIRYSK
ncbi:MAG: hypothetical protein ABJB11_08735 [Ferruginibacter sp.]